jgi:hypothetical protein
VPPTSSPSLLPPTQTDDCCLGVDGGSGSTAPRAWRGGSAHGTRSAATRSNCGLARLVGHDGDGAASSWSDGGVMLWLKGCRRDQVVAPHTTQIWSL